MTKRTFICTVELDTEQPVDPLYHRNVPSLDLGEDAIYTQLNGLLDHSPNLRVSSVREQIGISWLAHLGKDLSQPEYDAVIAGLRLLACGLEDKIVEPNDGDIGDMLTCGGLHTGLTSDEIHDLCDRLLTGPEITAEELLSKRRIRETIG